jgi:hypothetical protein
VGISFLAAVAVPMYFEGGLTAENGACLLAQDLRAAQNRAAYSGQTLFMRFFEDGDGYEVVDSQGEPISDPRTARPFVRQYSKDGVFEGLVIRDLVLSSGNTLVFSASGEISSALECTLHFEDEVRHLVAKRPTGIVTIPDSTSGFVDDGY